MAFIFVAIGTFLMTGCDNAEIKTWESLGDATIELSTTEIHSEQGRSILIEAEVSDLVGLRSLNLTNTDWFLDKTIEFIPDSTVTNYSLSYNFLVPEDASDNAAKLVISVENLGGDVTTKEVSVEMDGDFNLPTLTVSDPIDGLTLQPVEINMVHMNCSVSDDRRLGYLTVASEKLSLYDSISFADTVAMEYTYKDSIDVGGDVDSYEFAFTVADSAGNRVQTIRTVNVSSDFEKLYLSDVKTEAELLSDLYGVPMLIDKVAPFTFQAKYYSSAAGTEVKFIPQKGNFTPHCYGIDPANNDKLINNPETALPIVLPEQGYYVIDLNLETLDYTVEKITPEDDPYSTYMNTNEEDLNNYVGDLCICGVGWSDFENTTGWGWDGPSANRAMTVDPNNPYLYTREVELEGKFELIFAPYHPSGWWMEPYWRFDSKENPEKTILKGGDNIAMEVSEKATYVIVFDTYLNRSKAILKK